MFRSIIVCVPNRAASGGFKSAARLLGLILRIPRRPSVMLNVLGGLDLSSERVKINVIRHKELDRVRARDPR